MQIFWPFFTFLDREPPFPPTFHEKVQKTTKRDLPPTTDRFCLLSKTTVGGLRCEEEGSQARCVWVLTVMYYANFFLLIGAKKKLVSLQDRFY